MSRDERNKDIVRRMRDGDPLQPPGEDSFFPPRSIIKKDKKEMKRVYGTKDEKPKLKPVEDLKDD